jgi:hypothetical protein
MPGPARLVEHGPGHAHQVGLAGGDDGLGLLRFGDQAHGDGRQPGLCADALGKGQLVAGAEGDLLQGREAPRGHVDEVAAPRLERLGQYHALLQIPAALHPVGGRDAHAHRLAGGEGGAYPRRRLPAESAGDSPGCRRRHRRADWPGATGTHAADSHGRRAPRRRPGRCARRGGRRPRRPRGYAAAPPHPGPGARVRRRRRPGPMGRLFPQPPSARGISWPPSQGTWLEALRPAWASCTATGMAE